MRYQVRAGDDEMYGKVVSMLREAAEIILELPRRHTLAVTNLGPELRNRVEELGATVQPDYQYSVDPVLR
jgi:hypothetical protein